jgi:hypothetical protein
VTSEPGTHACLRCGFTRTGHAAFCRRCGLPFGAAPQVQAEGAPGECPVCYAHADRGGLYPAPGGGRRSYEHHAYDHELRPVGDDDWLETQRDGDLIVIGRWRAPYDLTRRYLVTGQWDGGPARTYVHNAVVLAMVGAARERADAGPDTAATTSARPPRRSFGLHRRPPPTPAAADPDLQAPSDADVDEARHAVDSLRERYLRGSRR